MLYQPVHRRSLLKVEVRKIDMDNWKRRHFLCTHSSTAAHFHNSTINLRTAHFPGAAFVENPTHFNTTASHPRTTHFPRTSLVKRRPKDLGQTRRLSFIVTTLTTALRGTRATTKVS